MSTSLDTRLRSLKWLLHLLVGALIAQGIWHPKWLEWVIAGLILAIVLFVFWEAHWAPHRRRLEAAMRKTEQQQAEWEASQRQWAEIKKKLGQP